MRGVTLLEILISVAIIAIVATMLIGVFGAWRASGDLEDARSNVMGLLKDARSRTLASKNNTTYGVRFETERAVLFKGTVYSSSDPANENYNLPGSIKINDISLTGGAVDTVFTRLNGTTTASGTITLESKRNQNTRLITIFATGNAE